VTCVHKSAADCCRERWKQPSSLHFFDCSSFISKTSLVCLWRAASVLENTNRVDKAGSGTLPAIVMPVQGAIRAMRAWMLRTAKASRPAAYTPCGSAVAAFNRHHDTGGCRLWKSRGSGSVTHGSSSASPPRRQGEEAGCQGRQKLSLRCFGVVCPVTALVCGCHRQHCWAKECSVVCQSMVVHLVVRDHARPFILHTACSVAHIVTLAG
jgi:hypothetical protein